MSDSLDSSIAELANMMNQTLSASDRRRLMEELLRGDERGNNNNNNGAENGENNDNANNNLDSFSTSSTTAAADGEEDFVLVEGSCGFCGDPLSGDARKLPCGHTHCLQCLVNNRRALGGRIECAEEGCLHGGAEVCATPVEQLPLAFVRGANSGTGGNAQNGQKDCGLGSSVPPPLLPPTPVLLHQQQQPREEVDVSDGSFEVRVEGPNGMSFKLRVRPTTRVENLRWMVLESTQIPVAAQILKLANGRVLADGDVLSAYGIREGDTIRVERKQDDGSFEVQVMSIDYRPFMLRVRQNTRVEQLRAMIYDKTGIPGGSQTLMVRGKTLVDGNVLGAYGVGNRPDVRDVIQVGKPQLGGDRGESHFLTPKAFNAY